jgi:hypothetical protein
MPFSEPEARAILIDARKTFLKDLFTGCKLHLKNDKMLGILGWMGKDIASIKKNVSSVGTGPSTTALQQSTEARSAVADLSTKLFGGRDVTSVLAKVGAATPAGEAITQFLDVMPGVGSIFNGIKALKEFGKAAEREWKKRDLAERQGSLRAGDPRSAAVAVG